MQITIVGCGKIGQTFAEQLVREGHDVTIIDSDGDVVQEIGNRLDVMGYVGNGAYYKTLEEAGVSKADMVIAVTESDEVNMLSCLTAHKLGVRHTAARVREPSYSEQLNFLKEDIGLSMIVNPELSAAKEIARILRTPSAARVEVFAGGRMELVSLRISERNPLAGMQLAALAGMSLHVLFCAVDRGGKVVIPDGSFTIHAGDTVYITGSSESIVRLFGKMGISTNAAKDVIIAGGGRISYYLSGLLQKTGANIKIIERDKERAERIASEISERKVIRTTLDHHMLRGSNAVSVVIGDTTNYELLQEEGITECSAFVALTGIDEGNLLSSMYAATRGVPKVITKVNNHAIAALIQDERLDSVISPRDISANRIVAYVRSLQNASIGGGNIESMYRIAGGQAEVLEFKAGKDNPVLHRQLKDMQLKEGVLLASILRGSRVIIPSGSDYVEANDRVMVVTRDHHITKLSDILLER